MKRFKGFTLTELMVALAVIGIIVAIVTPTIMRTRPNRNKMMIKKAYYTTENIVNSLINDTSLYDDMSMYCRTNAPDAEDASQYCAYGFDWDEAAEYEGDTYSGDNKFQKLFASKLNVTKKIESDMSKFETADGMIWDFTDIQTGWTKGGKPSDNIKTLTIDVNGEQGPNCYEADCEVAEDFDQFRIDIQSNGKMKVNDADTTAMEFVTINASVTH